MTLTFTLLRFPLSLTSIDRPHFGVRHLHFEALRFWKHITDLVHLLGPPAACLRTVATETTTNGVMLCGYNDFLLSKHPPILFLLSKGLHSAECHLHLAKQHSRNQVVSDEGQKSATRARQDHKQAVTKRLEVCAYRDLPCRWKLLPEVFLGILYAKKSA